METVKRFAQDNEADNRTCEFIASLPEDILAQFILQSPTPDFAEPFDLHAIGCVTCARKIHAAAGSYLKKHPELALPEKVEQLRQVVLDRTVGRIPVFLQDP